jgi:hypothetical protein
MEGMASLTRVTTPGVLSEHDDHADNDFSAVSSHYTIALRAGNHIRHVVHV